MASEQKQVAAENHKMLVLQALFELTAVSEGETEQQSSCGPHVLSHADTHTPSTGEAKHDVPARVTELQAGREHSA